VESWQPKVRPDLPDPGDDLSQAYKISGDTCLGVPFLGGGNFPIYIKFPSKKFPRIKFPVIFFGQQKTQDLRPGSCSVAM